MAVTIQWPVGKEEFVEVVLDGEEERWFRSIHAQTRALPPSPERTALVNEVRTIMDMKALLDARLRPDMEPLDAEPVRRAPDTSVARTEGLAQVEAFEAQGFKVPQVVKDELAHGQLALDQPGALGPEEVDLGLGTKAKQEMGVLAPDLGSVIGDAPVRTVGEPGVYGGRVPSFTLPEAQAAFEQWRGHEYGWLRVRVLLLAQEHGEYHSEMLVGLPLSNRSLIGAVTNVLGSSGLMEALNKDGAAETRISSSTSRRRSNVWRLTAAGRSMASELARDAHVVSWAFPERRAS
jgi:hypothetical protein